MPMTPRTYCQYEFRKESSSMKITTDDATICETDFAIEFELNGSLQTIYIPETKTCLKRSTLEINFMWTIGSALSCYLAERAWRAE